LFVKAEQRRSTLLIYLFGRKDHARQHTCRGKKGENYRRLAIAATRSVSRSQFLSWRLQALRVRAANTLQILLWKRIAPRKIESRRDYTQNEVSFMRQTQPPRLVFIFPLPLLIIHFGNIRSPFRRWIREKRSPSTAGNTCGRAGKKIRPKR